MTARIAQLKAFDTIWFSSLSQSSAVGFTLADGGAIDLTDETMGRAVLVTAAAAGNAIVTGAGNDTLTGGAGSNSLDGGAGANALRGNGVPIRSFCEVPRGSTRSRT